MEKTIEPPENWLIAHRGDHAQYAENTLAAFVQAADAGARFAECDIQFTRDLVAVVIHDNHLERLCNLDLYLSKLDLIDLKELCRPSFKLLTLKKFLTWLAKRPQLILFLEIKPDIRDRISDSDIAGILAGAIEASLLPQIVIISESVAVLEACRAGLNCRIGWVAEGGDPPASTPDYVFMPYSDAAAIKTWHDKGVKVGLYTINDAGVATEMRQLGADLIESDHFSRLRGELDAGHDKG